MYFLKDLTYLPQCVPNYSQQFSNDFLDIFLLISLTWGLADFPFGDEPCCTLVLGALQQSHGLHQLIISILSSSLSYFIMFCWKGFLEYTAWGHFSRLLPFHKHCLGRFGLAIRKSLDYKQLSHNITQSLQKTKQNILSFLSYLSLLELL